MQETLHIGKPQEGAHLVSGAMEDGDVVARAEIRRHKLEGLMKLDETTRVSAICAGLAIWGGRDGGVVSLRSVEQHLTTLGTPLPIERIRALLDGAGFDIVQAHELDPKAQELTRKIATLKSELREDWPDGITIGDVATFTRYCDELVAQSKAEMQWDSAEDMEAYKSEVISLIERIRLLSQELKQLEMALSHKTAMVKMETGRARAWFADRESQGVSLDEVEWLLVLEGKVPLKAVLLNPDSPGQIDQITIDPEDLWFKADTLDGTGPEGASWLNWSVA